MVPLSGWRSEALQCTFFFDYWRCLQLFATSGGGTLSLNNIKQLQRVQHVTQSVMLVDGSKEWFGSVDGLGLFAEHGCHRLLPRTLSVASLPALQQLIGCVRGLRVLQAECFEGREAA